MTAPWIAAFAVLSLTVLLMLIVLIGVVRRVLGILDEDPAASSNIYARSLHISNTYGGLLPGTQVPLFVATTAAGETLTSSELFGQPLLCLFTADNCPPCTTLLAELAAPAGTLEVPLLVFADDPRASKWQSLPAGIKVLEQVDQSASKSFQSTAFPQAFALDERGVVRAVAIPNSFVDLRTLARALEGGDRLPEVTQIAAA